MPEKRQFQRFIVKLPVKVSASGRFITGTTVRVSRKGFFVRAQSCFEPGTGVTIDLILSESGNATCQLKGIVKYIRNFDLMPRLNGMGIELAEPCPQYQELVATIEHERG